MAIEANYADIYTHTSEPLELPTGIHSCDVSTHCCHQHIKFIHDIIRINTKSFRHTMQLCENIRQQNIFLCRQFVYPKLTVPFETTKYAD